MNDFTKEELEWLYDEIDGVIEQFEYEDERAYSCRDKLKSMIDNYCEHEFQIKSLTPHFLMMREKCSKTFVDGSFPG